MNTKSHSILGKVLEIEHTIYCATNCRLELPLHKRYYEIGEKRYTSYVRNVLTPKYDW